MRMIRVGSIPEKTEEGEGDEEEQSQLYPRKSWARGEGRAKLAPSHKGLGKGKDMKIIRPGSLP